MPRLRKFYLPFELPGNAKYSRSRSQPDSEVLLRPIEFDYVEHDGPTSALSISLDEFEDSLRFSGTNLFESIQNSMRSTSYQSIANLSEEDKEAGETKSKDDWDENNELQVIVGKAQQKSTDESLTKSNNELIAMYAVVSDQVGINSENLLLGTPYSPTVKGDPSDGKGNFQFPSDKRKGICLSPGCCKRNNIKPSAVVAIILFCLLFLAIILASTISNKQTVQQNGAANRMPNFQPAVTFTAYLSSNVYGEQVTTRAVDKNNLQNTAVYDDQIVEVVENNTSKGSETKIDDY